MQKLSYLWLPLIACLMLGITFLSISSHLTSDTFIPPPIPISPYKDAIAGTGVVEPQGGLIKINSPIIATIKNVYVTSGQKIKIGDRLFELDNQTLKAELEVANAKINIAKAELEIAKLRLSAYQNSSAEHVTNTLNQLKEGVQLARAKLHVTEDGVLVIQKQIDSTIIQSPINGTVLKINIHGGEIASPSEPAILLGNIDELRVRVEIDESDIGRFEASAQATGILQNNSNQAVKLKYVKEEPLVGTKKTFTGSNNELIDTRVFQIIYTFNNTNLKAHVGQRMDVYIKD